LSAAGTNHLDKRRRAAHQGRFARRFVCVLGKCSHEWEVDVHMRIDEPWKNVLRGGVDDLSASRSFEVSANAADRFALAENISYVPFAGRDNLAILDEE